MAEGMKARRGIYLFRSLRGYRRDFLPHDAVAGMMLLAIALPGQLATARLAGLPAESGLLAFVAGSIGFAVFGWHRFASVAADSTIAPIFAGTLAVLAGADPARAVSLAALLALLVGIVLVIIGAARAGWIADLLSIPVTVGFLAGIAVQILVGQIPGMLGITAGEGHVAVRFATLIQRLPEANLTTTALGLTVLVATLLGQRRWRLREGSQGGSRGGVRIPGALLGLAAAGLAVWSLKLEHRGVAVLGPLTPPVPRITLGRVGLGDVVALLPVALTVSFVCMMQTAAVTRSFPAPGEPEEEVSRDFGGVGAGNILAALLGTFAVDASPPSTAVVAQAGGRSQAAALIAAAAILAIVVAAGQAFAYVPVAALSAVLVVIACRIFRIREMIAIARSGGPEIFLVAASAFLVIALPIEMGVGLSIVLSLLHSITIIARPASVELVRIPGTTIWWTPAGIEKGEHEPGVLVFAPAAPVNFTNANYIHRRLELLIAAKKPPVQLVVIDASGVDSIDYTGATIMRAAIGTLRKRGIEVALARLGAERARRSAAMTGLLAAIGPTRTFYSAEDAVQALKPGRDRGRQDPSGMANPEKPVGEME
ncbi:MAG TPA: SulP family inorganic anion transporter [Acetobacteraceae bacterium]|nr:SulP family inorganic anion transporter [Acetobacteraceae bacterium]